ncbi:TonB C-terminal domain-containing protein [bacterium]|nr:TonB C-terminal domain-containing protein [bacterium]
MNRNYLGRALFLSLLIHILILLSHGFWDELGLISLPVRPEKRQASKRMVFDIVETQEASRVPPAEADHYSDKDAVARDAMTQPMDRTDRPYSEGIAAVQTHEPPPGQDLRQQTDSRLVPEDRDRTGLQVRARPSVPFSREMLVRGASPSGMQVPAQDQSRSSAVEFGGFQLNTYAWDFAPYLLELRRRIQRNIYPPQAFTYLGLGGNNVLRFRILRDGTLVGPKLLEYGGEKVLVETSQKAVETSAPFPPLPGNFPEDFLEITARFQYLILNNP